MFIEVPDGLVEVKKIYARYIYLTTIPLTTIPKKIGIYLIEEVFRLSSNIF